MEKAIIASLHGGKGIKYIEISLLSVSEKVYGRVLMEKLMEVTEVKVSERQEGFKTGKRSCEPDICY